MTIYFKNANYTIVYDQRGVKPAALRRLPQLKGDYANVVYNDVDLSRYPNLSNDIVYKKLQDGASLVELIIDEMHVQSGGALWDFFKGPRDGPSPQFRQWLAEHGDEAILDLRLSRQPLSNYLTRFLDLISLGGFSAKVDELGYDVAEHWGLVVTTTRGSYLIEKNAFIEARHMTEQLKQVAGEGDPSISNVDAKIPANLNIRALIDNASKEDPNFWRYRGNNENGGNCQKLVQDLLNNSNIEYSDQVAIQDAQQLFDSVGPAKSILNVMTDTAHTLDRVLHGDGANNKAKKKKSRTIKKR